MALFADRIWEEANESYEYGRIRVISFIPVLPLFYKAHETENK